MPGILIRLTVCASALALPPAALLAQQYRIAGPIDDAHLAALPGSLHPQAQPLYDQGPVDPSLHIPFITLTLKPSAIQQAGLERLLEEQADPSSPNYRRWLSPEQFADRFGLASRDYDAVVSWLESRHLHIEQVARARNWVAFSGPARNVELAFQTHIHRYLVDGQAHFANATDVSIPAALQDLAGGIRGLDDFWRLPPAAIPQKGEETAGNHGAGIRTVSPAPLREYSLKA